MSWWFVTWVSDRSVLGTKTGEVSRSLTVVDLTPIDSTIPCKPLPSLILSPGWNLFSLIIKIPAMIFLNISWAPKATATEKSPRPAIIGPISIPHISSIIVIATIQIRKPATLLSQVLMAGVNQELSPITDSSGLVRLEKALKIV